jgi:hypothetical protein
MIEKVTTMPYKDVEQAVLMPCVHVAIAGNTLKQRQPTEAMYVGHARLVRGATTARTGGIMAACRALRTLWCVRRMACAGKRSPTRARSFKHYRHRARSNGVEHGQ